MAFSGRRDAPVGTPFSIFDSAAGTLFGPASYFTTASLAPGATLNDAGRSGSVSSRVNEFFNTKAFVPAPLVLDGQLIDGDILSPAAPTISVGAPFSAASKKYPPRA